MTDLSALAQKTLDAAKKAGADDADVLVVDGTSLSIEVRAGEFEHADRSEGVDIGLRVLIGGRQANLSISDQSSDAIAAMAERAVAMAKEAPVDPNLALASSDQLAKVWDVDALQLWDPSEELSPKNLQDMALEAEAAALAVEGVAQSQGAGAGLSRTHMAFSDVQWLFRRIQPVGHVIVLRCHLG